MVFVVKHHAYHITPILHSLHWLPINYHIQFKVLLFVYKALNNLALPYLSELIVVHNPARSLRSQTKHLLLVPRARLKCRDDRAFAVAGPKLWNNLPLSIRTASSVSQFKSLLKTYIFSHAFNILWLCFLMTCLFIVWLGQCNCEQHFVN